MATPVVPPDPVPTPPLLPAPPTLTRLPSGGPGAIVAAAGAVLTAMRGCADAGATRELRGKVGAPSRTSAERWAGTQQLNPLKTPQLRAHQSALARRRRNAERHGRHTPRYVPPRANRERGRHVLARPCTASERRAETGASPQTLATSRQAAQTGNTTTHAPCAGSCSCRGRAAAAAAVVPVPRCARSRRLLGQSAGPPLTGATCAGAGTTCGGVRNTRPRRRGA